MHDYWGAVTTYCTAALALLSHNTPTLMTIGGAILLIARLVVELPRAMKAIREIIRERRRG